jgi:hypothetical protein
MIGPGWMPSRPRPLGRVRRSVLSYTAHRRRRRTARRSTVHLAADGTAGRCDTADMLFDGLAAELPTATLLPGTAEARRRVLGGHLRRWLDDRWAWLRPRTVPMIVAFAGMMAVLGTTKYLSSYACGAPQRSFAIYDDAPAPRARHRTSSLGHLHIVPVRPGSRDVTITLEP